MLALVDVIDVEAEEVVTVGGWVGTKSNPLGLWNTLLKGVIFPVDKSRVPTRGLALSLGSPTNTVPAGHPAVLRAWIAFAALSTT